MCCSSQSGACTLPDDVHQRHQVEQDAQDTFKDVRSRGIEVAPTAPKCLCTNQPQSKLTYSCYKFWTCKGAAAAYIGGRRRLPSNRAPCTSCRLWTACEVSPQATARGASGERLQCRALARAPAHVARGQRPANRLARVTATVLSRGRTRQILRLVGWRRKANT